MDNATLKILLASALIAAGTGAAMAKGPGGGERMNFETLDVDGSGEITAEDFATLRDNRFSAIDADGDGSVTLEEFTAAAAARSTERATQQFERLDVDGDGVLSRDTLGGGGGMGQRMLTRLDTDDSGGVSEEEFEAAKDRMAKRRDGGERGWGKKRNN